MSANTPLTTAAVHGASTHVRNTSGHTRVYGYLGANGKQLASNQDYFHSGDLLGQLSSQHDHTRLSALLRDLELGHLHIIATPATILHDTGNDTTHQLTLVNNNLGLTDPPWAATPNSAFVNDT